MRLFPAILLPALLSASCLRITAFCETDEDCPAGWMCGAQDRCTERLPEPADAALPDLATGDLAGPWPATCLEARALFPGATDGDFTLYVDHEPRKPWTAYCFQMNNNLDMGGDPPTEYLTLAPGRNVSRFPAGGKARGIDIETTYWRVRLDPRTLEVDANDRAFATSFGELWITGMEGSVYFMPFGVALDCAGAGSARGSATIDLSGTPFAVVADLFVRGGTEPGGSATYTADHKRVALRGGGACGWVAGSQTQDPLHGSGVPVPLIYQ